MEFYNHLTFILFVFFCASFVRSAFGFGSALLAMPLLLLFLPPKSAAPLLTMVELSMGIIILITRWRQIAFKQLSQLLASALIGIPLGIFCLKNASNQFIRPLLAGSILLFVVTNSLVKKKLIIKNKALTFLTGIISGFLGGVGNISGPPIVIYASLKGWNPTIFMATLQGHFLITGAFIFIGHGISGLWNQSMFVTWLVATPVVIVASLLGNKLNMSLSQEKFYLIINGLLFILAIFILIQSLGTI